MKPETLNLKSNIFWRELWDREKRMIRLSADFMGRLWVKMDEDDILFLASGVAFNVLACLLPILLFIIYALGLWFQSGQAIQFVDNLLKAAFPNQPYAEPIRQGISSALAQIVVHRKSLGLLSLAVLLGTSATLFSSLRTVLHRVFKVKASRHFVISYLVDLSLVLGLTLIILFLICLSWLYQVLRNLDQYIPPVVNLEFHGVYGMIPNLVSPVLIVLFCCLLYRCVPAERIPWRTAFISALTSTMIWLFSSWIFAWYLGSLASFSRTYGAYAFLIVLLLWIFYSSVIFVLGAEVGQVMRAKPHAVKSK